MKLGESAPQALRGLCDVLQANAQSHAHRLAYQLLAGDDKASQTLTYQELAQRASAGARNLTEAGLAGRSIALMAPSSCDFIVSFFAILWTGGTVVPLAPLRTSGADKGEAALLKLSRLLAIANVAAVIADATVAQRLLGSTDRSPVLRTVAVLDIAEVCQPNQPIDCARASETAVVQFTSGSTSAPKGVCVTHQNFTANSATMARAFNATDDDVMLHWLPLYHDMGLIGGIVAPLCNLLPSTIIPATKFAAEPSYWLRSMSNVGATMSTAPNFAYQLCAERMSQAEIETLDLSGWRAAICGSEPIQASVLRLFAERFAPAGFNPAALFPTFGLAEATIYVSGGPVGRGMTAQTFARHSLETDRCAQPALPGQAGRELVSCGQFPPEHDIVIVEPQSASACADNAIGEIWLRGPGVAAGYLEEGGAGVEVFNQSIEPWGNGFLATGDLGFLQDGELYVVGRLRDLIILDGVNRYPQDIEIAASGNDADLAGCINAAFQAEDGQGDVILIQEVHRRPEAAVLDQLRVVRQRVANSEQIPLGEIVAVPRGSVPRTSSGKVSRRQARALWQSGALKALCVCRGVSAEAPVADTAPLPLAVTDAPGDVAAQIASLWHDALGHTGYANDSSFFEVGGTSLQLTSLHAALLKTFGIEVSLVDLMEHTTVTEMARLVEATLDPDVHAQNNQNGFVARGSDQTAEQRYGRRMAARSNAGLALSEMSK